MQIGTVFHHGLVVVAVLTALAAPNAMAKSRSHADMDTPVADKARAELSRIDQAPLFMAATEDREICAVEFEIHPHSYGEFAGGNGGLRCRGGEMGEREIPDAVQIFIYLDRRTLAAVLEQDPGRPVNLDISSRGNISQVDLESGLQLVFGESIVIEDDNSNDKSVGVSPLVLETDESDALGSPVTFPMQMTSLRNQDFALRAYVNSIWFLLPTHNILAEISEPVRREATYWRDHLPYPLSEIL